MHEGWFEAIADAEAHRFEAQERIAAVERERRRVAGLTLRDRLRALANGLEPGERITIALASGELIAVIPGEFGADWFAADLVGEAGRGDACIVPLRGIAALLLTRSQAARSAEPDVPAMSRLAERFGIATMFRDLARRRELCEVELAVGSLTGTIDRVGRDHLEVAEHGADGERRASDVARFRILPIDEVRLVRLIRRR